MIRKLKVSPGHTRNNNGYICRCYQFTKIYNGEVPPQKYPYLNRRNWCMCVTCVNRCFLEEKNNRLYHDQNQIAVAIDLVVKN